jgi:hypothetical protein
MSRSIVLILNCECLKNGEIVQINTKKDWRYHSGNNTLYIEEQTTQWPNEKGQNNRQLSTNY